MNMKKNLKGLLSLWMTVLMLVALLPVPAMACEEPHYIVFDGVCSGISYSHTALFPFKTLDNELDEDSGNSAYTYNYKIFDGWKVSLSDDKVIRSQNSITLADLLGNEWGATCSSGNIYLYSVWKQGYSVTFYRNDGTDNSITEIYQVVADEAEGKAPPSFSRSGYTFTGWDTEKNGTGTPPYGVDYKIKNLGTTTLYAQWAKDATTPQITVDPQGETYCRNETPLALSITVVEPTEGTQSYQWYKNNTGSNSSGTKIEGETKAQYTPSTDTKGDFWYYCVVTNTNTDKNDTATATSAVAKISVVDHVWRNWSSSGNGSTHKRTCSNDTDHVETANCSGSQPERENEVQPKCDTGGSYDEVVYCSVCNQELRRTHQTSSATGHDYGDWTSNRNGTHTRTCENDPTHTEIQNCSGGNASCADPALCDVCKHPYGNALGHDWVWADNGDGTHTGTCENDPKHTETYPHDDTDADGVCDYCKYEFCYDISTSVNPTDGGTVSASPPSAKAGDLVSLTATENDGWKFSHWVTSSGSPTGSDFSAPTVSFTMPANDVSFTAVFIQTLSGDGSGSAIPMPAPSKPIPGIIISGGSSSTSGLPIITSPSAAQSITAYTGNKVTLTVTALHADTYQWYENDGSGYRPIPGATSPSYTTSVLTQGNDGYRYYCVVSNAYGASTSPVFMLNMKTYSDVPKTGDNSQLGLWIGLMALGLCGMAMMTFTWLRKRRGN